MEKKSRPNKSVKSKHAAAEKPEVDNQPSAETLARIQAINSELAGASEIVGPVKLAIVAMSQLDYLEENARFMRNETFLNLVANIKRDKALTSVPYCWLNAETGRYLILSGNHRVKAAQTAGHKFILIMYNDAPLTEQERIAIQLSHNAIAGEDDPAVLQNLWKKITQVELKSYSGLDDKTLGLLEKLSLNSLSDVRLDFRVTSFAFLPEEAERLEAVFEAARKLFASKTVFMARFADFDRLLDHQKKIQSAYNLKNAATSLMLMLDIFEAHMDEITEGWEHRDDKERVAPVPLASIFAVEAIPLAAGKAVLDAVRKTQAENSEAKDFAWKCLLFWSQAYLERSASEAFFEKTTA